jgi:hypothetical protein
MSAKQTKHDVLVQRIIAEMDRLKRLSPRLHDAMAQLIEAMAEETRRGVL